MTIKETAPSPGRRDVPHPLSASKSGRKRVGGVMRAFNPFDSVESVEEIEECSIPNGGPGAAYFSSPPPPPPPPSAFPPPPPHGHMPFDSPQSRTSASVASAAASSSVAGSVVGAFHLPPGVPHPLSLERSSSHSSYGASETASVISFESAREAPPQDDQVVMTPGEAEDLAELRSLLPMFRKMKKKKERGGQAATGGGGRRPPPRMDNANAALERAASPPPLLPPFREDGLDSDGGRSAHSSDPEHGGYRSSRHRRSGHGQQQQQQQQQQQPPDLLIPTGTFVDVGLQQDSPSDLQEQRQQEEGEQRQRSAPPGSGGKGGAVRKRHRRKKSRHHESSSSMLGHISPGMQAGVCHGVHTTRGGGYAQGGSAQNMSSNTTQSGGKDTYENEGGTSDSDENGKDGSSDDSSIWSEFREATTVKLSRDVYSLLYFTMPLSISFFFAIGVFVFQMLILALIMVDIIDRTNDDNPLNIPSGVSTVVRISQFLAVLIAVATQDDLITAINTLHTGYDGGLVQRKGIGGYKWQWLMSVFCRFAEGGICLTVTFILIMQSEEVVELFLDFLAVTFVSTLDDIAFALARDGYFSKRLRKETGEVLRVKIPKSHQVGHFFRPAVFLVVSTAMLIGWGVVSTNQKKGVYLSADRIAVQFGDEFRATLGFFSSIYEVKSFDSTGRPIYREIGPNGDNAQFAYCPSENSWTFSYAEEVGGHIDSCSWYAKSDETYSWDIMAEAGQWYVYGRESKGAVPFQHFSLRNIDCDDSERGECSMVGTCIDNECVCNPGRYGLNCEFEEPCESLAVDTSTGAFPGPVEWSNKFTILYEGDDGDDNDNSTNKERKKAKVYERPVYWRETGNGTHHVIMFTGRRWILAESKNLVNSDAPVSSGELAEYLTRSFHAHWTPYQAEFMSSPTDVVTPTDAATPVGLDWYRTKSYQKGADENFPIQTQLLCTKCDDKRNPCSNGGTCGPDGRCSCKYGTFGALCQIKNFILCRSIAVQFGDELISFLPAFSGVYDMAENFSIAGRSVYLARRLEGAMFAYCESETAWTFTLLPPGERALEDADPCEDWRAMSKMTETYDISSLRDGWTVRRNSKTDEGVPFLYFQLECVDCDRAMRKNRRPCSSAGTCVSNSCACDEGNYGITCQLYGPCPVLEVDSSRQVKWPSRYDLLRHGDGADVKVYERPVYVSDMSATVFYIIIFSGRRWIITRSDTHLTLDAGNGTTRSDLARYLADDFHGYYSNYTVEFISESVQINTNMDTASPVDLNWYEPKQFDNKRPDFQYPLERSPNCAFCNQLDYPCYNKGVCNNGKCTCRYGTFGNLCQVDSACISLSVEFGQSLLPPLPSLSGDYTLKGGPDNTYGDRPIYLSPGGRAMLAYCEADRRWTFTHWDESRDENPPGPCGNWTARSGATYSYDITETTKWQRKRNATSIVALLPASFSYACNDERRNRRKAIMDEMAEEEEDWLSP